MKRRAIATALSVILAGVLPAASVAAASTPAVAIPQAMTVVPQISAAFNPADVFIGARPLLTFTITNGDPSTDLTNLGFSDVLPGALRYSNRGVPSNCGGTATISSDSRTLTYSGGSLDAGQNCTVTINVGTSSATAGIWSTTTTAVTATGHTGNQATASLDVLPDKPTFSSTFDPARVGVGQTTSLTFSITNMPDNPSPLIGLGFTDRLPAGLKLATASVGDTCGGGVNLMFPPATDMIVFDYGASAPPHSSCKFSVTVVAGAVGSYALTTRLSADAQDGYVAVATANLKVVPGRVAVATSTPAPSASGSPTASANLAASESSSNSAQETLAGGSSPSGTASASNTTPGSSSGSGGSLPPLLVAGVVVIVFIGAGTGAFVLRRRRSS